MTLKAQLEERFASMSFEIFPLIITIAISSNVIGASAALYLTNHPEQHSSRTEFDICS